MVVNKFKRPLFFFLIISLLISLHFNHKYYKKHQEEKTEFSIYLNDFYYELDRTISSLGSLIRNEPTDDSLRDLLIGLKEHLNLLDYMLRHIPYYMPDLYGGYNLISRASSIIYSGDYYREQYIPPFGEDHTLSQKELAFFRAFKAYLEKIRDYLMSEETGQLNREIDKHMYNKLVAATLVGNTEYLSFLDAYLDYDKEVHD